MKTEYRVYFTTDGRHPYLVTRVDIFDCNTIECSEESFKTLELALEYINSKGYTTYGVRIV